MYLVINEEIEEWRASAKKINIINRYLEREKKILHKFLFFPHFYFQTWEELEVEFMLQYMWVQIDVTENVELLQK